MTFFQRWLSTLSGIILVKTSPQEKVSGEQSFVAAPPALWYRGKMAKLCALVYKQRYNDSLLPPWHVYDSIYWHFWEEEKLRLHDMWSGRMMIGARSNRKKSGSPAGLMTGSSQLRSACPAVGWSPTRGRASYWTRSIWIF